MKSTSMHKLLYTALLILLSVSTHAQKTFCEGWEDGYTSGKQNNNEFLGIIPICPIAPINADTYEDGYSRGYEKATGNKATVIKPSAGNDSEEDEFCAGWEDGYASAMRENRVQNYITPICPIAPINADSYQDGFIKGRKKAFDELNIEDHSELVGEDANGTFCNGWEDGYQAGLQLWATENETSKPMRITSICPIAGINEDGYKSGYSRGKQRALEDMK